MEGILSVEGVDAFIVGPYDLSGSLGVPGQFDHADVIKALKQIHEVAEAKDAISGYHVISPEIKDLEEKVEAGYRFIAFSLDILFLGSSCRQIMAYKNKSMRNK